MTLRTRTHIHVVAQFGLVGWFAEIYGKSVPELGPGGLGGAGEDRMLKSIPFRIFPGHTHTHTHGVPRVDWTRPGAAGFT